MHAAGFIGGAWSLESCLKMAEASLKQHEIEQEEKRKQQELEEAKKAENEQDLEKK